MVQPLEVPSSSSPSVFSTSNITGAPLITLSSILAAVAQYLAVNGTAMPTNTNGWISFGLGIVMAVVGALARVPGKAATTTIPLVFLALTLNACKGGVSPAPTATPGPARDESALISLSVYVGASAVCTVAQVVPQAQSIILPLTASLEILRALPTAAQIAQTLNEWVASPSAVQHGIALNEWVASPSAVQHGIAMLLLNAGARLPAALQPLMWWDLISQASNGCLASLGTPTL